MDQMDQHDNQQDSMIAAIQDDTRETADWTGRTALSPRVLDAMRTVRREAFVPEAAEFAYENRPLVIGHGQTISQPFIVGADDRPAGAEARSRGAGGRRRVRLSGRRAGRPGAPCVLDRGDPRTRRAGAQAALAAEGCTNVEVRLGDGAQGWPEHAPFDAIIVTAAAPEVPPALVAQLRAPGRMVIPVGAPHGDQSLRLLEKDADGVVTSRRVLPVAFVPLTRNRAWEAGLIPARLIPH